MTSERSGRTPGPVDEDRPAPAWAGDVHAGVEAWTRSSRLSKSGSAEADDPGRAVRAGADGPVAGSRSSRTRDRAAESRDRAAGLVPGTAAARQAWPRDPDADPGVGGAQDPARRPDRAGALAQGAGRQAGEEGRAGRAGRAAARPVRRGRPDRRRGVRHGVDRVSSARQGTGDAEPWPTSCDARGSIDEVARDALAEIDPDDEEAAARVLVRKKLRSVQRDRPAEGDPAAGGHAGPQGLRRRHGVRRRQGRAELDAEEHVDAGFDEEF